MVLQSHAAGWFAWPPAALVGATTAVYVELVRHVAGLLLATVVDPVREHEVSLIYRLMSAKAFRNLRGNHLIRGVTAHFPQEVWEDHLQRTPVEVSYH